MVHHARATVEKRVSQPQPGREIGSTRRRIDTCLDDPQMSAGYLLGFGNDEDFSAVASRLEEKSPKAPPSERRERTFPAAAEFPDLPDGILGSRLVNGEYVWEGDEHVFSSTGCDR